MELSNSYQVLAESQEDGEDDGVTPIQELATNTEISAEEHLDLSTARRTTSGDDPSGSAQGLPRVTGASSSAGAVVTADASANRAQNWTNIIESSEADENGFIQPRRKRKRGGASTPDSRLPRATATARTEVRSFNRTSRNSGGQTSSIMRTQPQNIKATKKTGRR
ncbi:hypothetical protein LAZ67_23000413 [Cordylochernes scorpioides]|uniref:Uncharacterized protein n=1 Tax=Cordylochernes scorpioides TaxID=51811 RepID=A0ABY6LQC9_9ARAC|nr:hypothetical protein LAZ67_23000413 [Cordylochernes scorpioides]